jgi:hypothetical protein
MRGKILFYFFSMALVGCVKSDTEQIVGILSKPIEVKTLERQGFRKLQECGGGFGCYERKFNNNIVFVVPDHGEVFTKNLQILCSPVNLAFCEKFKQELCLNNAIFDGEGFKQILSPNREGIVYRFRVDSIYYHYGVYPFGDYSTVNIWYDFESNKQ